MNSTYSERIMTDQSVDETASTVLGPAKLAGLTEHAFYVVWGTGVTAGVVEIETAHDEAYTGTWAPLQTVTFSGTAPKQDIVQVTGSLLAARARISTAVSDGTVSVDYLGAQ